MASLRIELTQRFLEEGEADYWENLKIVPPYKYRKIYPMLSDIDYPMEIPDDPDHCEVVMKNDVVLTIKGAYSDIAQAIDDREQQEYGDM